MKRGYVKLWRKTIDSLVFAHEGMLKLFILCLLKANHEPADVTIPGILSPIHVESGQFITGRNSLYEDYHQLHLRKRTRRKPAPHATTLYRWLLTLQDMSILHIKSHNKYSIISIINWNQYQQVDQQMIIKRSTDDQQMITNKKNKNIQETLQQISSLKKRYDPKLIDQVFDAIRSTRKKGKVADSVLLGQLILWKQYDVAQVEAGIKVYLIKGYAGQDKKEDYLLGIIRRQKKDLFDRTQSVEAPQVFDDSNSIMREVTRDA